MEQNDDGPDFSQLTDQDIAEALADKFHANPLRKWMASNGLERSRGANKMESARQAVDQDREGIALFLYEEGDLDVEWDRRCEYHEACGNTTAGASVRMCDECTDLVRQNDREGVVSLDDFDDMTGYMEALYRVYDG
jgi:hypothetical protein